MGLHERLELEGDLRRVMILVITGEFTWQVLRLYL